MEAEPFDYTSVPLPTPTSIRLVQVHSEGANYAYSSPTYASYRANDVISCTLKVHEVEDLIAWDALSYTWGNPITVYRDHEEAALCEQRFKQKLPIVCNGKILMVGANLHDALLAIRRLHRKGDPYYHANSSRRAKCTWIDAICIDQTNLEERSVQVGLMRIIYLYSQHVIIWLGEGDVFARRAVRVIQDMSEAARCYKSPSLIHSAEDYARIGLDREINLDHFGLYAFLQRSWFRRVWTLQEATLAPHALMMCGDYILPWLMLWPMIRIMNRSTLFSDFVSYAEELVTGRETIEVYAPFAVANAENAAYHETESFETSPFRTMEWITHGRRFFQHLEFADDPDLISDPEPPSLLNVLVATRASRCSDPRDRIYGLGGIVSQGDVIVAGPNASNPPIPADYRKTVLEVYLEAAWFILRSGSNLRLLSHIYHPAKGRNHELPSWVPDWSVSDDLPESLEQWYKPHFEDESSPHLPAASKDSTWHYVEDEDKSEAIDNSRQLSVQAIVVGEVQECCAYVDEDLHGLQSIYKKLPRQYQYVSSVSRELEDVTAAMESSKLSDDDLPTANTDPIVHTRFEALWRTLIADQWPAKGLVANRQGGRSFVERQLYRIHLTSERLTLVDTEHNHTGVTEERLLQERQNRIESLAWYADDERECLGLNVDAAPSSSNALFLPSAASITTKKTKDLLCYDDPRNAEQERDQHHGAVDSGEQVSTSVEEPEREEVTDVKETGTDVEALVDQFLPWTREDAGDSSPSAAAPALVWKISLDPNNPEIEHWEEPVNATEEFEVGSHPEPPESGMWNRNCCKVTKNRVLFTVQAEKCVLLGLGPQAMRVDDQAWLLGGCDYPMILRKEGEHYTAVGPAFIHGIMRGEAWNGTPQDIVIK